MSIDATSTQVRRTVIATIATATGSVSELLFPAYAKPAGLDPKSVKIQGAQTTALNSLMAQRKVDGLSTFLLSKKALETASKKQVVAMKPYVSPPNGAPLGHMDQERVARSIAVLQSNGLMPAGLTPDKVVDFSFIKATS